MLVSIVIFCRKGKTFNFGNSSLSPEDLGGLGRIQFVNTKGHWMPICVPRLGPERLGPGDTKKLSVYFTSEARSIDILKAFDKFLC